MGTGRRNAPYPRHNEITRKPNAGTTNGSGVVSRGLTGDGDSQPVLLLTLPTLTLNP